MSDSCRSEIIDISGNDGKYDSNNWDSESSLIDYERDAEGEWVISKGQGVAGGGRSWSFYWSEDQSHPFDYSDEFNDQENHVVIQETYEDNVFRFIDAQYVGDWGSESEYSTETGWKLTSGGGSSLYTCMSGTDYRVEYDLSLTTTPFSYGGNATQVKTVDYDRFGHNYVTETIETGYDVGQDGNWIYDTTYTTDYDQYDSTVYDLVYRDSFHVSHENGGADRESSFSRHHESTASYEATLQRSNETPYVTLFTRTEVFQSYADRFSYEDTTRSIREDGSVVVLENRATDEIDALWKFEVVNGTFTDLEKSFTQVRHDHSDRDDGAGERTVSDTDIDVKYDWIEDSGRNLQHNYGVTTFPGNKPDNPHDHWIDFGTEGLKSMHPSELIMPYDGPFDDQTGYPMFLEMAQWFEYENPGLAVDDGNSGVPGLSGPNTPNAPAPEEASKPSTGETTVKALPEGFWERFRDPIVAQIADIQEGGDGKTSLRDKLWNWFRDQHKDTGIIDKDTGNTSLDATIDKILSRGKGRLNTFDNYLDNRNLQGRIDASKQLEGYGKDVAQAAIVVLGVLLPGPDDLLWGYLGSRYGIRLVFEAGEKIITRNGKKLTGEALKEAEEILLRTTIARHSQQQGHFPKKTLEEIDNLIRNTIKNGKKYDHPKRPGRTLYHDKSTNIIVIIDGNGGGTMYRPDSIKAILRNFPKN